MLNSAIILAAGLGTRLKPLTDEFPKCLTEINGQPILFQQLRILWNLGIHDITIVVGYLGDKVKEAINSWALLYPDINFVYNNDYLITNTAYSALLASDVLQKGCLVIEGDVIFSENVIKQVLAMSDDKTYWLVSRCKKEDNGAIIKADETGKITSLQIIGSAIGNEEGWKSSGIKKISTDYGKKLCEFKVDMFDYPELQNLFLDEVMVNQLKDEPSYILDISNDFWAEIDCQDDIWRAEKDYPRKKYIVVILDGAADNKLMELGNVTPLSQAYMPSLNNLTKMAQVGLLKTIPIGLPACSIVAILGLLGYNPTRYYPYGRASLEALANDIYLDEDEIAFRCNAIKIDNQDKIYSASADYDEAIYRQDFIRHYLDFRFYRGQDYRNILIVKESRIKPSDLVLFPPHENLGKNINDIMPAGKTAEASSLAEKLNCFIGESKIYGQDGLVLWPWSPSLDVKLPSFALRHGIEGAIITAMDFFRGIGIASGLEAKRIPGVTGFSDTNLNNKLTYAISALKNKDIVFIHINAPDEESHKKDAYGKVTILERIDQEIIGPLVAYLEKAYQGRYRMAVLADHYSFTDAGGHGSEPTPFIVSGFGIKPSGVNYFTEALIERNAKTVLKGYEFMGFLTKEVA